MFIIGQHGRGTSTIQRNLIENIRNTQDSSQRLSSGRRVNRATDDPGNIGTISRLNAKIGSISEALRTAA